MLYDYIKWSLGDFLKKKKSIFLNDISTVIIDLKQLEEMAREIRRF